MTTDKTELLNAMAPLLSVLSTVNVDDPTLAQQLNAQFPVEGELLASIRAKLVAAAEAGWLTPREADGVKFGRLAKPTPETYNMSIDAVDMNGPGPGHTHPNGEIDLCFALSNDATFDRRAEGWTTYGRGSWHVPTVRGGRMLILYFLPGGAIRFEPHPG